MTPAQALGPGFISQEIAHVNRLDLLIGSRLKVPCQPWQMTQRLQQGPQVVQTASWYCGRMCACTQTRHSLHRYTLSSEDDVN